MIVNKSTAEYAEVVRRVASGLKLYRVETITDLNQAAGILEDLARRETLEKTLHPTLLDDAAVMNALGDGA
jgi:hypothetical protein